MRNNLKYPKEFDKLQRVNKLERQIYSFFLRNKLEDYDIKQASNMIEEWKTLMDWNNQKLKVVYKV